MAMWLDYKPTRYEGKGFLRNLNLRIHRDITGDRCGLGWGGVIFSYLLFNPLLIDSPTSWLTMYHK